MEINITNAALILLGITIPMIFLYHFDKDFDFACFGVLGYLLNNLLGDINKWKKNRMTIP